MNIPKINGIPVGTEINRVSSPVKGDRYIDGDGDEKTAVDKLSCFYPILAPAKDNAYGRFLDEVLVEITTAGFKPIDGDDWYRYARKGEQFWGCGGGAVHEFGNGAVPGRRIIITENKKKYIRTDILISSAAELCAAETLVSSRPNTYSIIEK